MDDTSTQGDGAAFADVAQPDDDRSRPTATIWWVAGILGFAVALTVALTLGGVIPTTGAAHREGPSSVRHLDPLTVEAIATAGDPIAAARRVAEDAHGLLNNAIWYDANPPTEVDVEVLRRIGALVRSEGCDRLADELVAAADHIQGRRYLRAHEALVDIRERC